MLGITSIKGRIKAILSTGTIQPIRLQSSQQKDTDYSDVFLTVSGYGLTADRDQGNFLSQTFPSQRMIFTNPLFNVYLLQYLTVLRLPQPLLYPGSPENGESIGVSNFNLVTIIAVKDLVV